ncbi:hypothetical protein DH2020_012002 [Rehmannia glutinosa]|uniref:DNA-directed RNA polymerase n=1 Tax=Rehmannia glutinosa TaxID=99300 RepID=A0ABR0XF35_REHGL
MWRNLSRQSYLRKLKIFSESHPSFNAFYAVKSPQDSIFTEKTRSLEPQSELGFSQDLISWRQQSEVSFLKNAFPNDTFRHFGNTRTRGYAAVAEALVSTSGSEEEVDEIQELIEEINKEINVKRSDIREQKQPKMVGGMGLGKYNSLRRRQIKMETEAWEEAAKEYQELLMDMCEQKLAPNLPYIKSLFLGWFEPLRDAIAAEQDLCKEGKNRGAYAPYIDQLPADMMAVITMHKLMGLLMTGGCNGSARVVQAACHIGEAIEHEGFSTLSNKLSAEVEGKWKFKLSSYPLQMFDMPGSSKNTVSIVDQVRIHKFLENCKRKNALNRTCEEGPDPEAKEQERLKKKVKILMKKQKLHQVQKIVRQQDDVKPWGQDAQVKVGCRLIQILTQTAYIQPPIDQMDDAPPDIRPAFVHTLKSVETVRGTRRYGVIECDPLVRKGLEKTARHMVIPYMPMLVPPLSWTGYERGAYLFLPSYIMRTHGAKQQREAVKRSPKQQLEPIFQALNTLGNTRWKVNKKILGVVDRIWANGGRLADLVDRDDVPLPEEPDTEDESEMKKWKWKVKAVKKENSERHSQRCDIELKLADGSCNGLQHYAALGRDKLGAAAVNLVMEISLLMFTQGLLQEDAAGDPATDPNVMRARLLIDQVDRKLVKQTVMTSVYGVTYIGARDQIKRRLKERGAIEDDTELFACACYAAKTTLTALGEMFEAARSIMSWLGDCAKIIANENQPVRWTTPLGLPVVQPYRKLGRHMIKTSLQVLTLQRETDKVMAKRQRTAFPPNFVHSLDGSHMMMTAIACSEAGLSFAAVGGFSKVLPEPKIPSIARTGRLRPEGSSRLYLFFQLDQQILCTILSVILASVAINGPDHGFDHKMLKIDRSDSTMIAQRHSPMILK